MNTSVKNGNKFDTIEEMIFSNNLRIKKLDIHLDLNIMNNGTGIHWPSLDEDLSLKGFLRDELLKVVKPSTVIES
jgi:hypothetical protein